MFGIIMQSRRARWNVSVVEKKEQKRGDRKCCEAEWMVCVALSVCICFAMCPPLECAVCCE